MKHRYLLPPRLVDATGQPRRAGFEFELGNLPVVPTAETLQSTLGGELEVRSPFEAVLTGSLIGRLKIERDAALLKSVRYRKWLQQLGVAFAPGTLAHDIETNIDNASRVLIPCEVVTEPIPFESLHKLDALVETLSELGGEGTQQSIIYAFGMHINPSLPASDAGTLRRYIQAFLLLHSWLIEDGDIDITRRFLTKFIDPFPREYAELVLDMDYLPDTVHLIDDYLRFNPTRNRALDLLPVLAHLDESRVHKALPREEQALVSARPAFHYRLPDCKIGEPGWSAASAWNQWVYIEKLAADQSLLQLLVDRWRRDREDFSLTPNSDWTATLTGLLSRRFLENL
jgi:hypothetical protein